MAESAFHTTGVTTAITTSMLANVRWIALTGQISAIMIVHFGLGFPLPLLPCLLVIGISALVGLWQTLTTYHGGQISKRWVFTLLGFDTLQLAVLIYLTGGLANPFAIMFLAPITVSATILSQRETAALVMLVVGLVSVLALYHYPLPWLASSLELPPLYMAGLWAALVLTTVFIAIYAGLVASQARRLARGLAEARLTLEREQQMVALGSLATAAAHKLGSPLNTITLVAHDLDRHLEMPADMDSLRDDILLLKQETERCRQILAELNEDAINLGRESWNPMPVSALIQGLIEERFEDTRQMIEVDVTASESSPEPRVTRRPEILHSLETLIDNAVQFARQRVLIHLTWDDNRFRLVIDDDGPGFQSSVLARLGDPYVSSRAGAGGHMGLGIFIAYTMVEQINGQIRLMNRKEGGARVVLIFPRRGIDVDRHDAT